MTKRIASVSPPQAGKVLGTLHALLALIVVPFFLLFALFAPHDATAANLGVPQGGFVFLAVILPVFYGVAGFIGGAIAAAVYNVVAGWTGGLEFTVVDVPPAMPVQTVVPSTL